MTNPLLEISDLSVEFGAHGQTRQIINGISFTVERNEIIGLVGESGSGKSTTARSVIGLLPPTGRSFGRIVFDGNEISMASAKEIRSVRGRQIGFVAQNPFDALNPILTIERQFFNVMRAHEKISRKDSRARAEELLRSVGINDTQRVLAGHAHELSGGMAQRVVIAIALSLDPKLLIADEPTTALDMTVQRRVLDLMREIILSTGRSMLLVTHDLTVVATYCDRVAVMFRGDILEVGDVQSVFTDPQHEYTRALLNAAAGKGLTTDGLRERGPSAETARVS
ncbi:ABC transporter ATP-binding protein [Microbacterium capsulatum]|uniref:ABC transporter ATP-binding protein n=1 Tax=Microbacterium capsulatum TaxID=3041921 RepID=A0ABU0XHP0_9MICO|nr:ABC transporter ATP-binding protein [Microbacterium sp. ASV81]MDQ4214646.1 ABC transporter ATP-binding protein [Microbacterium sp. ASV81]